MTRAVKGMVFSASLLEQRQRASKPLARLPERLAPMEALSGGALVAGRVGELVVGQGGAELLHALLAAVTGRGLMAALVDAFDGFCAGAAAAAGVSLEKLLWIRPGSESLAWWCAETLLERPGFSLVAIDFAGPRGGALAAPARAAWARLRRAAARSSSAVVLLATRPLARGAASFSLRARPRQFRWAGSPPFDGYLDRVELEFSP
ncbi:MAG: hypothetical protein D6806_07800 [Deltaproteobacteria bacterium]|nr:MAG: hypothetical protein D6806_07800 [Deltaproteobacteria bacterium]